MQSDRMSGSMCTKMVIFIEKTTRFDECTGMSISDEDVTQCKTNATVCYWRGNLVLDATVPILNWVRSNLRENGHFP